MAGSRYSRVTVNPLAMLSSRLVLRARCSRAVKRTGALVLMVIFPGLSMFRVRLNPSTEAPLRVWLARRFLPRLMVTLAVPLLRSRA